MTDPVTPATLPRFATLQGLLAAFLVHVVLWIGGILFFAGPGRVSFEHLGDASTPWVRQFVLPLLIVLAFQVGLVSYLRSWPSVLREPSRTARRWLWFPVGGIIVGAPVLTVASDGWTTAGSSYLSGVVATVLLVGVCEELAFRGYLLVGARRVLGGELPAVLFTSALFGLFHLPNSLLGTPFTAELVHVAQTAVLGLVFYALRRLSGTLLVPVLVHAAWDLVVLQANSGALTIPVP